MRHSVLDVDSFDAIVAAKLTHSVIWVRGWKMDGMRADENVGQKKCSYYLRCKIAEFDGTLSDPRPGQNSQTKWLPASMTASGLQMYLERCF